MDEIIQRGLKYDRTIDISTKGRRSGRERRIEIWFFNVDGKFYITGSPGTRGWYANMVASPEVTFHLKHTVKADIPARSRPITLKQERDKVLLAILDILDGDQDLDDWIARSPLVEIKLDFDNAMIIK